MPLIPIAIGVAAGGAALYGVFKGTEKATEVVAGGMMPMLLIGGIVLVAVLMKGK